MALTLSKAPYNYEEFLKDNGVCFVDNVSVLTAIMFTNVKVRCPCTGKVYDNKYSFRQQHCKSKRHVAWLTRISEKRSDIIKTSIDRAMEIKDVRIRLEREGRKNLRLEKKINDMTIKEDEIRGEYDEIKTELDSMRVHLERIERENSRLQKQLEKKNQKLAEYEAWIRTGVEEVMGCTWEDDDASNSEEKNEHGI
jgi:septal ring factor EnvC (AmiA/AmiB activator)